MTENWKSPTITLALFFFINLYHLYIYIYILVSRSNLSDQHFQFRIHDIETTQSIDYDKFSKVKLNYSFYWSKSLITLIYVVGIYSPCMLKTNIWLVFLSSIPSLVFSGAFHAKHKDVICFAIKHYFFTHKKKSIILWIFSYGQILCWTHEYQLYCIFHSKLPNFTYC